MPKVCSQCQSEAPDEAEFCSQCGGALAVAAAPQGYDTGTQAPPPPTGAYASPTGGDPPPPAPPTPPAGFTSPPQTGGYTPPPAGGYAPATGGTPTYSFNAARWSTADRITGIASLVLLISLLLPWFDASGFGFSVSVSGLSAHGYLYLVFFVSILILVYLAARAGWDKLPISATVAHTPVMLGATLFNLVIVVLAFLLKPGGSGVGWSIGAFLALIAALVAVAPIAIPAIQSRGSAS
jgi:hypothetical protein